MNRIARTGDKCQLCDCSSSATPRQTPTSTTIRHRSSRSRIQRLRPRASPRTASRPRRHDARCGLASPLVGPLMTAEPCAANRRLDVEIREGRREVSAGEFETRNDHEAQDRYHDIIFGSSSGALDVRLPGRPERARILACFDTVIDKCHSGGCRTLQSLATGCDTGLGQRAHERRHSDSGSNGLDTSMVMVSGSPRDRWSTLQWDLEMLEAGQVGQCT